MERYRFPFDPSGTNTSVQRISDTSFISLTQGAMGCDRFLFDWKDGAAVTNADGSPAPYSTAAVVALGLTPPSE